MNKSQLIEKVVSKSGLTISDATKVVNIVTSSVTNILAKGEAISIIRFCTFKINKRAARMGRNPRTGAEFKISAKNRPVFSSGKALKNAFSSLAIFAISQKTLKQIVKANNMYRE